MKKILIALLFFGSLSYGQTKGISYQALIINPIEQELPGFNNNQAPLANKNICLKFSFIDELNSLEYEEIFTTTTDDVGMVNLIIGTEDRTGGYASSFEDITWSSLPKNLKVDLSVNDGCSNFIEISNVPFTAVPYALFALNTENTPLVLDNEAEIILLKSLLATTQLGAGLNTDGTYSPNASSNFITSATSLNNADTILDGQVKNNETTITTNTSDIATNAAAVANNTISINTNTSDIAVNSTNITTNTTGIADNTTAINERVKIVDVVDDLTTGGTMLPLSAEQGKVLKNLLDTTVNILVEDDLTSTSTTNALSANQGRELKGITDTNSTDIDTNTSGIATNVTDIATNTSAIATNVTDIATNATNIATNTSAIATNVTDIGNNATNIATNTSGIATNVTDIATNATNIATNTSGIATNVTDIGNNATNIATNTSAIATNVTDIATNATNIATNTSAIATNVTDIGNNATNIATNTSGIATNVTDIGNNATNIATNTSAIATNVTDIATNVTDIATNTSGIATNVTDIATNATNIATNTSGIATNVTDIATNATNIATNTSAIATNVTDIATNTTNIATNTSAIATNVTDIGTNASTITAINTLVDGKIYLGDVNGAAQEVTLSGDVTMSNAGVTSIGANKVLSSMIDDGTIVVSDLANDAVTNVKIATGVDVIKLANGSVTNTELQYIGTLNADAQTQIDNLSSNGSTNASAITAINSLVDGKIYLGDVNGATQEVTLSGDVTLANDGTVTIENDAVSFAKVQNIVTANRVLGSTTAGGIISEVQVATDMIANYGVTNAKLDKANIPLSGFGAATADVALGANKLTGVSDPTAAQDAATKAYVDAAIPVGGIIMWYGALIDIPSNWQLCDGSAISSGPLFGVGNNTPDLTNRFIIGADSSLIPNTTGGSSNNGATIGSVQEGTNSFIQVVTNINVDNRPPYYALAYIMRIE
jgi:methyl-accepting chemotaxis protein